MNYRQMTTCDNFSNFLFQLKTFHNHVMTSVMTNEDLWMTLSTLCDDLLMILMTTGEDLLMTTDDNTDDSCDDIDL